MVRAGVRIAADAGIGIATARPWIGEPARKSHRLGLGYIVAEHDPERLHRQGRHFRVGSVAVEVDRRLPVGEAQQDGQSGLLLVAHPGIEGAPMLGRIGQAAEPFRLLGPEAPRKAQVDLAEDTAAISQTAKRFLLRLRRHRIENRQAGAQQADRHGEHRPLRFDALATLKDRGHAGPGPDDALDRHAVADIHPPRGIVDQGPETAPGLGVAVESLGWEPFLRRHLVPGRALHAFAHLDEGGDDEPVDLGQPPGTQQRLDRLPHRDRARAVHADHRLALPARPFDRGLEGHATHHGAAALPLARRRRRTLVDQQAFALRLDQVDAELAAPQGQRIAFDAMYPRAAKIERRAHAIVRPDAATETITRLEDGDGKP